MKDAELTAFEAAAAAFGFRPRQVVAPGILFFAGDLGVDEAVDGLVGDDRPGVLPSEAASHLLGRPAVLKPRQGPWRGACCRGRAWSPASAAPGPVGRHSLVGSPGCGTHCASVPEPRSMARDPELPQFGGESVPWCVSGPFHSGLQG